MTNEITVQLGDRSYPIYIGDGILGHTGLFSENISSKQIMVVSNETVAPLYLDRVLSNLAGYTTESVILADGEIYKTLDSLDRIITELLQKRFSRNCCLIALGGGVIGDITGFAAACYQRGVDYIQIPTTVLAQVDSSVGGKTAVNHELGKNMIGAFHQPKAVIADTSVLSTLDDRQLCAGLAEVIKYGLIRDKEFFQWLENNIEGLLAREPGALAYAIERSCKNKAEVVAMDEKESGVRALLNLGHTFGHAIETAQDYKGCLHGEAVAIGMLMAADLSRRLGWLDQASVDRVKNILTRANLPYVIPPGISVQQMQENMAVDKKARDGIINLVLLKAIGNAIVTNEYDQQNLQATLDHFTEVSEVA